VNHHKQPRGLNTPVTYIDDDAFPAVVTSIDDQDRKVTHVVVKNENGTLDVHSHTDGQRFAHIDELGFIAEERDYTNVWNGESSQHAKTTPHPYPFRPYFRKGTDKKTGKPIFEATIPPAPVNYQMDRRPMTTKEVNDAAARLNLNSSNKRFASFLRYMMQRAGYRLNLLPV
jgi:hypothetical protein